MQFGWDPGAPSPEPIAWVDPIEDGSRPAGEDARGVPIYQHPEVLRSRHPELAPVVDRFVTGARRKISRGDWPRLSSWEIDAVLTLRAAWDRERARQIRAQAEEARER
jgi:hypothetical protein